MVVTRVRRMGRGVSIAVDHQGANAERWTVRETRRASPRSHHTHVDRVRTAVGVGGGCGCDGCAVGFVFVLGRVVVTRSSPLSLALLSLTVLVWGRFPFVPSWDAASLRPAALARTLTTTKPRTRTSQSHHRDDTNDENQRPAHAEERRTQGRRDTRVHACVIVTRCSKRILRRRTD
jgi:hypothetical protein